MIVPVQNAEMAAVISVACRMRYAILQIRCPVFSASRTIRPFRPSHRVISFLRASGYPVCLLAPLPPVHHRLPLASSLPRPIAVMECSMQESNAIRGWKILQTPTASAVRIAHLVVAAMPFWIHRLKPVISDHKTDGLVPHVPCSAEKHQRRFRSCQRPLSNCR